MPAKSRTVTVKMVGVFPKTLMSGLSWAIRMKAAHFPFYFDSATSYSNKKEADKVAERWKKKTITLTISEKGA